MKREITLMIYVTSQADVIVEELKAFCKAEDIIIKENSFRSSDIYDFIIEGDTKDYKKIANKFGNNVKETYSAELGNVFDLDNETLKKWETVITEYRKNSTRQTNSFKDFCDLIKDVKDINKFEHLLEYPFDDMTKELIKDRISQLKGEKIEWEKWADNCLKTQEILKTLELVKEGKYSLNNNDIGSLIDILKYTL